MKTHRHKRAVSVRRRFANRLAAARNEAGFETRAGLAAALHVHADTYRRYERGEAEPPLFVLAGIAELTGRSLDFLVRGVSPRLKRAIRSRSDF